MSSVLCQVATTMQELLTDRADALARETGFVRRQRKLSGATFAQTLVFSWLHDASATLEAMTQTSLMRGVALRPQSLDGRFTGSAVGFLSALVEEAAGKVIAAEPVAMALLYRFAGGRLFWIVRQ